MKKYLILTLVGVGLFLPACSCATWTSFWGGDSERECADHWHFKKEEPVAVVKAAAKSPCEAPMTARAMQSYPVCDERGNALHLEKMAPVEVVANELFDYRIKVTNLTDNQLQNVMVTDRVPENLTVKSSIPQIHKIEGGAVHWMLGELEPKASKIITASAVAEGEGVIRSCAEVFYDSPICAEINIVTPKLRLTKFAPSESLVCDRIPLRYVLTNTGTGFACEVSIREILQEELATAEGANEILFTLDSLGPGKSQEFTRMIDAAKTGRYAGKALVTSRGSGTAESNITETTVSQPVLEISQSGPESQYIGRSMTYDIVIANKGDGMAKDTVVEATLPEDVRFDSATVGGSFSRFSPGRVVWDIGTLKPNESRKVSMTLTGDRAGSLRTNVVAKAYCADAVSDSAQTMLSGIPGILLEVVDVSDPIEMGQSETYVITVTNQGSAADTNIRINCMLEDNMQYISSSGPTMALVEGNKITFASLPSLAPKAQAKWWVNVKAIGVGDMRFKATMNSDQLSRPVEETEATTFYK